MEVAHDVASKELSWIDLQLHFGVLCCWFEDADDARKGMRVLLRSKFEPHYLGAFLVKEVCVKKN